MDRLRARFVAAFGADYYHRPGLWDTWDGVIPWPLFFMALGEIWRLQAWGLFTQSTAVSHAIALTMGNDEARREAQEIGRDWLDQATG